MTKKDYKLTTHFKFSELTVTDDKELKETNKEIAWVNYSPKIQALAEFAEKVRKIIGSPMIITSGFRCEQLNKKLGGSPTSKHRFCEAIDFIPKNISAFEAFSKILISDLEYHEVILTKRGVSHFIHIAMGNKMKKMYSEAVGKYKNV